MLINLNMKLAFIDTPATQLSEEKIFMWPSPPMDPHPSQRLLAGEAKKMRRRRNYLIYLGFELVVLMIVIWDDIARSLGR
jgi:hypothetical protein